MASIFKSNTGKDKEKEKEKEKEELQSNMSTMANTNSLFFQKNKYLPNQHIDLENKNVFNEYIKQFHKVAQKQGILTVDQKIDYFVLQHKWNASQSPTSPTNTNKPNNIYSINTNLWKGNRNNSKYDKARTIMENFNHLPSKDISLNFNILTDNKDKELATPAKRLLPDVIK